MAYYCTVCKKEVDPMDYFLSTVRTVCLKCVKRNHAKACRKYPKKSK